MIPLVLLVALAGTPSARPAKAKPVVVKPTPTPAPENSDYELKDGHWYYRDRVLHRVLPVADITTLDEPFFGWIIARLRERREFAQRIASAHSWNMLTLYCAETWCSISVSDVRVVADLDRVMFPVSSGPIRVASATSNPNGSWTLDYLLPDGAVRDELLRRALKGPVKRK